MQKRWFLVGLIFLLVPWLLCGCGIAQEQYDAVVADLSKAQQETQSVRGELETVQSKVSELTASLEKSQSSLEQRQTELETTRAENSELTSSLEKAETELEAAQTKNTELTSSLEKTQSELAGLKTENEDLEQANEKLKRLDFFETALCSERPKAVGSFKPQPNNTFKTNQTVWVYFEVFGWKYILVGDEVETSVAWSITILDAEEKEVKSKKDSSINTHERPFAFHGIWDSFGTLEAGNYTVEVKYTDNYSGETSTWRGEFQVEAS